MASKVQAVNQKIIHVQQAIATPVKFVLPRLSPLWHYLDLNSCVIELKLFIVTKSCVTLTKTWL